MINLNFLEAAQRLQEVVDHTPLQLNQHLSQKYECSLYLKREDLQVVRSYKLRGAYNMMISLTERELSKGVVCASAGNHAQGVAYSCNKLNVKGVIFMPSITPKQKIEQTRMFGGANIEIILIGDTFDDCAVAAKQYTQENEKIFVPPFDHEKIIEGQGTVGVELYKDLKKIDYILIPNGGGGLCAGVSAFIKSVSPDTKIIGVEPEGAPSMSLALREKKPIELPSIDRFVDGASVKKVGELTFELCRSFLDEVILVPEGKVCSTILQLYNKDAIVVEPAGALSIAGLDYLKEEIRGKNVVCIVSGSNNDIDRMQEIKERSLLYEGLKHYFLLEFPQRPGALKEFVTHVLGDNNDITYFQFSKKNNKESGPAVIGVEVGAAEDFENLRKRMNLKGLKYTYLNHDQLLFNNLIG
ncbi:threonine ammonia-lyase [Elizabethkingia argentiflava]|uniref:L-threonine dehydratase n=1 Tax=Elizabethkingia argenteiflava TaxID=2681556 RepID=A0A845PX85_9FLAO|nr:threonine ammonia-lyase [Elizabethkingia argenteiflava]NAW51466.1 threonine ammonia-lyase [Elizabethkingia argenteiflava]